MAPKISIIVPAFNEEKYISRCLDSILNQTFTDFEVICIDDGSTDNTFKIISDYAKNDFRVISLKNTGKGVSSARNYGIKNSSGEYIGFVDSDDFIQPQMYEFLYNAIIENNADMSCCNYIRTDKFNIEKFNYSSKNCNLKNFLIYENERSIIASSVCNKLIKKDLFYDKFYFEKLRYGEDTLFSSKLWINAEKINFVDLPLYCYYNNLSSVSYVDYSDEKWMDKINSDYLIFKLFLENNYKFAVDFYISLSLIFLLSYRNEIKITENYNENVKNINIIGKEYLKYYLNSNAFSLTKKLYVLISYKFPFLYKFYRKIRSK